MAAAEGMKAEEGGRVRFRMVLLAILRTWAFVWSGLGAVSGFRTEDG